MAEPAISTQAVEVIPGSYAKLSPEAKAAVDSILVSHVIDEAQAARADPRHATVQQRGAQAIYAAWLAHTTVTDLKALTRIGEEDLKVGREIYARQPEIIADTLATMQEHHASAEEMANFTRIVNDMITIDGQQFNLQADLPKPSASKTPRSGGKAP